MPATAINNQHLMHLCADRAKHAAARDAADTQVRALNAQIMEILEGAGVERHQLPNGTITSIVRQKDRASIVAERLLGHGVAPKVIEDSTKYSPVAPFVRVDAPKSVEDTAAASVQPGAPAPSAPATTDPVH